MIAWLIDLYKCLRYGHVWKEFNCKARPYQICLRCGHVEGLEIQGDYVSG